MAKEYVTVQGDLWDAIAKKQLGSEYYMTDLIDANPQFMETVIFPAGIKLTIPNINIPTTINLPPWKRGGNG